MEGGATVGRSESCHTYSGRRSGDPCLGRFGGQGVSTGDLYSCRTVTDTGTPSGLGTVTYGLKSIGSSSFNDSSHPWSRVVGCLEFSGRSRPGCRRGTSGTHPSSTGYRRTSVDGSVEVPEGSP